jgi:hypothetical protein
MAKRLAHCGFSTEQIYGLIDLYEAAEHETLKARNEKTTQRNDRFWFVTVFAVGLLLGFGVGMTAEHVRQSEKVERTDRR